MRILICQPASSWSTADVGRGYSEALKRAGHTVQDWRFDRRLNLMAKALDLPSTDESLITISYHASRMLVEDVVDFVPDFVLMVSGLVFHPAGLQLVTKLQVPIVSIFTESPYNIEDEEYFSRFINLVATNDGQAAKEKGWLHLPPSYDPAIHYPGLSIAKRKHDVVFTGTAWPERVKTFSSINWEGIDFGLYGLWPDPDNVTTFERPPVQRPNLQSNKVWEDMYKVCAKHIAGSLTSPDQTLHLYRGSKICINDHRSHPTATSLGPRVYEVLAVGGGLLLTDYREEIEELLGPLWLDFVYKDPADLERKIRYYLNNDEARNYLVEYGKQRVSGQTFDARVKTLVEHIQQRGWLAEDARAQAHGDSTIWQPSTFETPLSISAGLQA